MTVLLGIDLGERRIGFASGDSISGAVKPLGTLRRRSPAEDASSLERICRERGAEAIVVGLPLNADGSESEQSRQTREWALAIARTLDLPLTLRDEHGTSQDAEARIGRAPRGRSGGAPSARARNTRRGRIDREAAALIVQRELDARTMEQEA